jgi:hypothetical protein
MEEALLYGPIERCQVCDDANLESVLFLGFLPPVNMMPAVGSVLADEPWFPAEMLYCPTCHLAQLGYAVDPRVLFPPEYPYTSGSTRILRENFADLYRDARQRVGLGANDLVVDIGSNDGTLLGNFAQGGHRVIGIEPSLTAKIAEGRGIPTLMTFFDAAAVEQVKQQAGAATIVTAANVFAHIHGVHQVMDLIEELLAPEGVFISESHYLADLVDTLQYDTIYHEHLRYYSLTSLKYLFETHGFRIIAATRIPTHGGSIRVYATKSATRPVDASVDQLLKQEADLGLASNRWIGQFRDRVIGTKLALYELLSQLRIGRDSMYGIGAPSRASTLINYVGLDDGLLSCVLEIASSKKVNKYVPGRKIPVLDEVKLYADQPPYALLLSWHIKEELATNLKRKGFRGDFIVPLPVPHVMKNDDVVL